MAGGPVRLLLLPAAQAEAHIRRAAVPDHQRQGNGDNGGDQITGILAQNQCQCADGDNGQRKGHVGGGHPRDPHPLADKDLIHNVVQVVDHQGQGCGDRIPADQTANGFGLQGILFPLGLFHRSCSFLPRRGGRAAKKAPGYAPGLWATGCHPKLTFQTTRGWEAAGDTPEPLSSPIQTNCWLRNFTESAHGSRALTASREYLVSEESISFALG